MAALFGFHSSLEKVEDTSGKRATDGGKLDQSYGEMMDAWRQLPVSFIGSRVPPLVSIHR